MPTETIHFKFMIYTNGRLLKEARARADAQRLANLEARVDSIGEEVMDNESAIRQIDAVVEEMLQIVRRRVP
jgi:hypothetical protein